MKLLTVCIPCHNSMETMHKAIGSCLLMRESLEIIIVDNHSTDATYTNALEYQKEYPEDIIVIQSQSDEFDLKEVLDQVHGLYFKLLDSHDFFDRSALVKAVETLNDFIRIQSNLDAMVCDYKESLYNQKEKSYTFNKILPEDRLFGWHNIGKMKSGCFFVVASLIVKTSLVKTAYENYQPLLKHPFETIAYLTTPYINTFYYLDYELYCFGSERKNCSSEYYYHITSHLLDDYDISSIKSRKQRKYMARYLSYYYIATYAKLYQDQDEDHKRQLVDKLSKYDDIEKTIYKELFGIGSIFKRDIPDKMYLKVYQHILKKYRL